MSTTNTKETIAADYGLAKPKGGSSMQWNLIFAAAFGVLIWFASNQMDVYGDGLVEAKDHEGQKHNYYGLKKKWEGSKVEVARLKKIRPKDRLAMYFGYDYQALTLAIAKTPDTAVILFPVDQAGLTQAYANQKMVYQLIRKKSAKQPLSKEEEAALASARVLVTSKNQIIPVGGTNGGGLGNYFWNRYFSYPRQYCYKGDTTDFNQALVEKATHLFIVEGKGYELLDYTIPVEKRLSYDVVPLHNPQKSKK